MESILVEGVTYFLSSVFRDGGRVHNQRRPSHSKAERAVAGAFS
jgi:hypothetical protein